LKASEDASKHDRGVWYDLEDFKTQAQKRFTLPRSFRWRLGMPRSPFRNPFLPLRPRYFLGTWAFVLLAAFCCQPQESGETIHIEAHAGQPEGVLHTIWSYFGYDEPNYTYAPNGKKLLGELAASSAAPVYVRVHNLLTTGSGSASLKWGSTNAYTEDTAGKPMYSWTIIDRIFDTFHEAGIKPLVEIGFMPEALSVHPQPYRHDFPHGSIYTGWAYPPKDYEKWAELVFQFVHHLRERYGEAELQSWLWEVWNEPDIGYWQGTADEYFKLYDFSTEAVLRAFPQARIGGPDSTGPGNPKSAEFLRLFLEHCAHGKNSRTGKTGAPLDFISFHPKGSPKWTGDHVQMGIAHQLAAIEQGFKIVRLFPEWRETPIILGESDPEGCAACSAKQNPQNSYRNGPLYAAYTAEALAMTRALAEGEHVNLLGSVTWAFEFEDQPPFEGFRDLATEGIDKPALNVFRMFGLLGSERLTASSSAALPVDNVVRAGVRAQPDIRVLAAQRDREVEILVWNYHDDDLAAEAAPIDLTIDGLPAQAKRLLVDHFRIDSDHSNAFTAWKEMGSPSSPTNLQLELLERAGQLQLMSSPRWVSAKNRTLQLRFALPRQGVSLLKIGW
jgi:xylan 1,4-beta-xylosidase